jgi:hypothetical protein
MLLVVAVVLNWWTWLVKRCRRGRCVVGKVRKKEKKSMQIRRDDGGLEINPLLPLKARFTQLGDCSFLNSK